MHKIGGLRGLREIVRSTPFSRAPLELAESLYRKGRQALRADTARISKNFDKIESGSVVINLPDFEGSFELDARSHIYRRVILSGNFEHASAQAMSSLLSGKLTGDLIDIGANVGFYSVLFARHAHHRVLALEPSQAARDRLHSNLSRNGVANVVEVVAAAVGDTKGTMTLETIPGKEEYSSSQLAHQSVGRDTPAAEQVELITIDSLVAEKELTPSLIKMDIEGGEAAALRGAQQTFERYRPTVLFEYAPQLLRATGNDPDEVLNFFRRLQYKLEWISETEILATPKTL